MGSTDKSLALAHHLLPAMEAQVVGVPLLHRKLAASFRSIRIRLGIKDFLRFSGPGGPDPVVSTAPNGNYLITWSSAGQDGSQLGIYGQLYATDNSKIGGEIAINQITDSNQTHPDIDFFSDGSFIITWQTNDTSNTGIAGHIFSADGTKMGSEIAINATTSQAQRVPSVEVLSDDTALITWSSYGQSGNAYDIIGRLLSKDGVFQGDEFQINLNTGGNECESDVIELNNGNILVAYNDYSGVFSVYGQIISPTGTKIGSEINIDGSNSSIPTNGIDIAALVGGGFVATWQSFAGSTGSDTQVFTQFLIILEPLFQL